MLLPHFLIFSLFVCPCRIMQTLPGLQAFCVSCAVGIGCIFLLQVKRRRIRRRNKNAQYCYIKSCFDFLVNLRFSDLLVRRLVRPGSAPGGGQEVGSSPFSKAKFEFVATFCFFLLLLLCALRDGIFPCLRKGPNWRPPSWSRRPPGKGILEGAARWIKNGWIKVTCSMPVFQEKKSSENARFPFVLDPCSFIHCGTSPRRHLGQFAHSSGWEIVLIWFAFSSLIS